jgi:4-hydroxythreonine-4-phosphate dehydrogenase
LGKLNFYPSWQLLKKTAMMLLGHDNHGVWLRVALATTHLPIKDVSSQLTRNNIEVAVELASEACRDLGLPRARIGVCGLNPHAGEGGKMGTEEQTVIGPAVIELQRRGFDVWVR